MASTTHLRTRARVTNRLDQCVTTSERHSAIIS
jgi:hypothetical protein